MYPLLNLNILVKMLLFDEVYNLGYMGLRCYAIWNSRSVRVKKKGIKVITNIFLSFFLSMFVYLCDVGGCVHASVGMSVWMCVCVCEGEKETLLLSILLKED